MLSRNQSLTLCPTPRLVRAARAASARGAIEAGSSAWITPAVETFSGWIGQLCDSYLIDSGDKRALLSGAQSAWLWQSLVDSDVLVGEPEVASLAARAWRLVREYELPTPDRWERSGLSTDAEVFQRWARRFVDACDANLWVDSWMVAGDLPRVIRAGGLVLPGQLNLDGFERALMPLQASIIEACAERGVEVVRTELPPGGATPPAPSAFPTADDEFRAAVEWARAGVEREGWASVAIVVPDLANRLDQAERVLAQGLDPAGFSFSDPVSSDASESSGDAWHVSLGRPLSGWPLVRDALTVLRMRPHRLNQRAIARLLASPYLAGSEVEWHQRALAQQQLARFAPDEVTLEELQRVLRRCGAMDMSERLSAWQRRTERSPLPAMPSEWVAGFQRQLSELGFGAGRRLDSVEYQCLQRWLGLLEGLEALDVVVDRPIERSEMISRLTRVATSEIFREENTGAPIEVLGTEEAIGSRFDALWLMSLDAETWPGRAQRDPLIPADLQAGIPQATSDGVLTLARERLDGLLRASPVVAGSYVTGNDDVPARSTAMLPSPASIDPVAFNGATAVALERLDGDASLGTKQTVESKSISKGGVGLLRSVAACPFQAAARFRLGAHDVRPPRPGLGPDRRSTLAHDALASLWQEVPSQAAMASLAPADRDRLLDRVVMQSIEKMNSEYSLTIAPTQVRLERARLVALLGRWLEVELARPEFEVVETECRVDLVFGDLALTGQFDRMDRLADGRYLLIDYKLSSPGRRGWRPNPESPWRLSEPQLPAYLMNVDPQPAAVAFAQIKPDGLGFDGVADTDTQIKGVPAWDGSRVNYREVDSWIALVDAWRTGLLQQVERYVSGDASVDPAAGVCTHCHLQAFCRVTERQPEALLSEASSGDD